MAVDTIFDELGKMTVLELVELKNKIEEEWGITAAAPVAVAAACAAACLFAILGGSAPTSACSHFEVHLIAVKGGTQT